jgi:His-Xaa-Ser system protein HxsD
MKIDLKGNCIEITVPLAIYSLEVLHKCFYWYGERFTVDIEIESNEKGVVRLIPKEKTQNEEEFKLLSEKIRTDLIDFKTRNIVTKETRNVRDLLIAKAFAHSDEFEARPPGEITDPVGFNPSL